MVDFADLAIRTDYSSVDKATTALDGLTVAGTKAEQSTTRLRDTFGRFTSGIGAATGASENFGGSLPKITTHITDASRSMTLMQMRATEMNAKFDEGNRHLGAWDSIIQKATGHTGEHSLGLARIERNMAGVTEKALGLNSTLGLLGATSLKFGVGDIYTLAIVGGLALISAAYEAFTEDSRKATEQIDKMTKSLLEQARAAREATVAGREDLKLIAETNQQTVNKESGLGWRSVVSTLLSGHLSIAGADADAQAGRRSDAQAATDQATKNWTDAWHKAEEERTRKALEELHKRDAAERKAQEDAARYQELVRSTSFSPLSLDYARTAKGSVGSTFSPPTMTDREQSALFEPMTKASQDDAKTAAEYAVSSALTVYRETTGKWLDDASKHAKKTQDAIWGAAQSSANTIVNALNIGGGGKGSGIGGALGSSAGGAAGFALGGEPGEIIGSTLGGILGSAIGGLFDHGKAMREAAKAQKNINLELDQIAAGLSHNKLASALLAIEANLASTIASFNAALPGTRNEGQRNADIAQAKVYAEQQKQQAADQIAADNKYATESLTVRNLKALGQTDAANLQAFKDQQEQELAQAILDGRDATYQNNLIMTQNNELIAYQNGLLSTALRNAPTGFYGAAAYIGQYATPRSADPFGTGMPAPNSPVNPTGGLTPPGGSGGRPVPRDLSVTLVLSDGSVLTRQVVKDIDRTAAATGGAGSSRSQALDLYN